MKVEQVMLFSERRYDFYVAMRSIEVVSKSQIMFESKASRELKTERTRQYVIFQFAGQRSYRTLDGVLKPLLNSYVSPALLALYLADFI